MEDSTVIQHGFIPLQIMSYPSIHSVLTNTQLAVMDYYNVTIWKGTTRIAKVQRLHSKLEDVVKWLYIDRLQYYLVATSHLELLLLDSQFNQVDSISLPKPCLSMIYDKQIIIGDVGSIRYFDFYRQDTYSTVKLKEVKVIELDQDDWVTFLYVQGNRLFAACDDQVYSFHETKQIFRQVHETVTCLTYYEPLEYLITGGKDGSIKVWNDRKYLINTCREHYDAITGFLLLEKGLNTGNGTVPCVISSSLDATIRIWNFETGANLYRLDTIEPCLNISFMKKNKLCHYTKSNVGVWNLNQFSFSYSFSESPSLFIQRDGSKILTASKNGMIKWLSIVDGSTVAIGMPPLEDLYMSHLVHIKDSVYGLCEFLVTYSIDTNPFRITKLTKLPEKVTCMINVDGQLVGGTASGKLVFLEPFKWMVDAHNSSIYKLEFDGKVIVSSDEQGTIKTWCAKEFQLMATITGGGKCFALDPNENVLGVAVSGCVYVMDYLKDGNVVIKEKSEIRPHIQAMVSLPSLKLYVTGATNGSVKLWENENCIRELIFDSPIYSLCFANERGDLLVGTQTDISLVKVENYFPSSLLNNLLLKTFKDDVPENWMDFDPNINIWEYLKQEVPVVHQIPIRYKPIPPKINLPMTDLDPFINTENNSKKTVVVVDEKSLLDAVDSFRKETNVSIDIPIIRPQSPTINLSDIESSKERPVIIPVKLYQDESGNSGESGESDETTEQHAEQEPIIEQAEAVEYLESEMEPKVDPSSNNHHETIEVNQEIPTEEEESKEEEHQDHKDHRDEKEEEKEASDEIILISNSTQPVTESLPPRPSGAPPRDVVSKPKKQVTVKDIEMEKKPPKKQVKDAATLLQLKKKSPLKEKTTKKNKKLKELEIEWLPSERASRHSPVGHSSRQSLVNNERSSRQSLTNNERSSRQSLVSNPDRSSRQQSPIEKNDEKLNDSFSISMIDPIDLVSAKELKKSNEMIQEWKERLPSPITLIRPSTSLSNRSLALGHSVCFTPIPNIEITSDIPFQYEEEEESPTSSNLNLHDPNPSSHFTFSKKWSPKQLKKLLLSWTLELPTTLYEITRLLNTIMSKGDPQQVCEASCALVYIFHHFRNDFQDIYTTFVSSHLDRLLDEHDFVRKIILQNLIEFKVLTQGILMGILSLLNDDSMSELALEALASFGITNKDSLLQAMKEIGMVSTEKNWLHSTIESYQKHLKMHQDLIQRNQVDIRAFSARVRKPPAMNLDVYATSTQKTQRLSSAPNLSLKKTKTMASIAALVARPITAGQSHYNLSRVKSGHRMEYLDMKRIHSASKSHLSDAVFSRPTTAERDYFPPL